MTARSNSYTVIRVLVEWLMKAESACTCRCFRVTLLAKIVLFKDGELTSGSMVIRSETHMHAHSVSIIHSTAAWLRQEMQLCCESMLCSIRLVSGKARTASAHTDRHTDRPVSA